MFSGYIRAGILAGAASAVTCLATDAAAHGFAGPRFFPATIATDDPFVADELALPTVGVVKDEGGTKTITYAADFAKRITPDFAIEFGASYVQLRPPGGPDTDGFDNFSLGAKYSLDVDAAREMIFSVGIDADLGNTGARRIGAEDFTTISPALFFGKGFGDLAPSMSFLRAFAVTGSLGIGIPTKTRSPDGAGGFEDHPNTVQMSVALEYSIPYLQGQVRNVGLGAPFDRMIPVVELALETPFNRGGGKTTGTINPGLLWAGQYIQLGAEAVIPWNRASGHSVGFLAQLHFYVDDVFPATLGRPVFGD
ncbi:MAG TPA: hypothetical protein VHT51_00790 [Micropepsaceae bacterium]|jgi:hypothetical protein|nr:hypothetical protein [Micropepsaceae bacterium]